ncbi:hypothetical protein ACOZ38_21210 [Sphaerisporangium viridialbum]|uniref:hypothetical protein n=1 Tax=Sphaerisporangium viridialbum TaxID=46189 RepID=UPI003C756168
MPTGPRTGFLREVLQGWRVFVSIRWVAVQSAVSSTLWAAGVTVLGPVVAVDQLGGAPAWGAVSPVGSTC